MKAAGTFKYPLRKGTESSVQEPYSDQNFDRYFKRRVREKDPQHDPSARCLNERTHKRFTKVLRGQNTCRGSEVFDEEVSENIAT
jgi:hypothetical protein